MKINRWVKLLRPTRRTKKKERKTLKAKNKRQNPRIKEREKESHDQKFYSYLNILKWGWRRWNNNLLTSSYPPHVSFESTKTFFVGLVWFLNTRTRCSFNYLNFKGIIFIIYE